MSQVKKIFSETLVYSIGNILNRFLSFLLLPLYTHFFLPEDYGIFSIIYSFWFFVSVIYLYGMETAVQKFYLEEKDINKKKSIYGTSLNLILISSLLFSAIIFLFSDKITYILTGSLNFENIIRLLSLILIIDALSRFPMIIINSEQLSKLYTIINISTVVINITFNIIYIVFLKNGIESIFYSFLISYSFQLILSFLVTIKFFSFKIDKNIIYTLLGYSHYFIYYGLFLISLDLIDRFLLGALRGNDYAGIYSANYRLAMIMNLLISGFRTAWFPFFMNLKQDDNNKKIFSDVFTFFNFAGMFVFIVIVLFVDEFINIHINNFFILDPKYWDGITILPYILLAYFFFGLFTNIIIASFYKNKISYLVISSGIAAIINIILNLILIPVFSINGAAVSTFVSYLIMFLILYYLSQKSFYIKYKWRYIFIVWGISIIFVTVFKILSNLNLDYGIILTYKFFAIITFLVLFYRKILENSIKHLKLR